MNKYIQWLVFSLFGISTMVYANNNDHTDWRRISITNSTSNTITLDGCSTNYANIKPNGSYELTRKEIGGCTLHIWAKNEHGEEVGYMQFEHLPAIDSGSFPRTENYTPKVKRGFSTETARESLYKIKKRNFPWATYAYQSSLSIDLKM